MALIKCEECGKEISDKAKVCVNCGCPVESKNVNTVHKKAYKELTESERQKVMSYRKLNKEFWIGTRPLFMGLTIMGLVFVFISAIIMMLGTLLGISFVIPILFWIPAFVCMITAYIIYCAVLPNETIKWYDENKERLYKEEILK